MTVYTIITEREKKLILLCSQGLTTKQMLDHFKPYRFHSIETFRYRLCRKVGVKNAAHLVAWAYDNKILIPK